MPIENFIINVFCVVDELISAVAPVKILQRGFKPQLSDSEVITMEIVAEFLGIDTDKQILEYFSHHWKSWFPNDGSRSNFSRQTANLWQIKQGMQGKLSARLNGICAPVHMMDGFPIPVCRISRAHRSKNFQGVASFGYGASKKEKCWGFKENVVINSQGVIVAVTVALAPIDERHSMFEAIDKLTALLIGDRGFIGTELQEELKKFEIDLQTPRRNNMRENRPPAFVKWLKSTRRLIETVIGQLSDRFKIEKVRARDIWHLTGRIDRKVLAHTVGMLINKQIGNEPLQFDCLLAT